MGRAALAARHAVAALLVTAAARAEPATPPSQASADGVAIGVAAAPPRPGPEAAPGMAAAPPTPGADAVRVAAPPESSDVQSSPDGEDARAAGAPPPPRPRRPGLVLESDLGVLGFAGRFRHVAPPAYWLRAQLGYEPVRWLMVYGAAEVALTDTSESVDESRAMAFALWGFAGGVRATFHASERVALHVQGEAGAMQADVPRGSLALLGYPDAERLNLAAGASAGVEWYATDRHLALCAVAGARVAEGFAKRIGAADVPVLWDAGGGVRYTF